MGQGDPRGGHQGALAIRLTIAATFSVGHAGALCAMVVRNLPDVTFTAEEIRTHGPETTAANPDRSLRAFARHRARGVQALHRARAFHARRRSGLPRRGVREDRPREAGPLRS